MNVRTPDKIQRTLAPQAEEIWPWLVEGVKLNLARGVPRFYSTMVQHGIKWTQEPVRVDGSRRDNYNTLDEVLAEGQADCEDLAMARTAELRQAGYPAEVALIEWRQDGRPKGWHAVVARQGAMPQNSFCYESVASAYPGVEAALYAGPELGWDPEGWWIEDPSYALGMPDAMRAGADVAGPVGVDGLPAIVWWIAGGLLAWTLLGSEKGQAIVGGWGRKVPRAELAGYMREAGFSEQEIKRGVAVAKAESGLYEHRTQVNWLKDGRKNTDRGIWQISNVFHPEVSDDVAFNARLATYEARRIYLESQRLRGDGWWPWVASRARKAQTQSVRPIAPAQYVPEPTTFVEAYEAPEVTFYSSSESSGAVPAHWGRYVPPLELAEYMLEAGFPLEEVARGVQIAELESELYTHRKGGNGRFRGIWQLDAATHNLPDSVVFDPREATKAAFSIWQKEGWHPWGAARRLEVSGVPWLTDLVWPEDYVTFAEMTSPAWWLWQLASKQANALEAWFEGARLQAALTRADLIELARRLGLKTQASWWEKPGSKTTNRQITETLQEKIDAIRDRPTYWDALLAQVRDPITPMQVLDAAGEWAQEHAPKPMQVWPIVALLGVSYLLVRRI